MTHARKKVVLAAPRGFCAGVVRAIQMVERALERHGPPVYVRKEIVHNQHVVAELASRGAVFVDSEHEVPLGAVCLFSAHGVSPAVREAATERELRVIDATCPLVSKVHEEARRFARDGRTIILVGHVNHEEVEGTAGEAPNQTVVVESVHDVNALPLPREAPVAYLTQTTLSVDDTRDVVDAIRRRFTDIRGPGGDDICYASQNRQVAIKLIAPLCDVVLVVGAQNSSNSVRMVEVARQCGTRAYLVPEPGRLETRWLDEVATVGVGAGASAPERLVTGLLDRLSSLGYTDVEVRESSHEDVVFSLPGWLRAPADR